MNFTHEANKTMDILKNTKGKKMSDCYVFNDP